MQELEAQRILDKIRTHAKQRSGSKKAWGAPKVTGEVSLRSLSHPVMSPTTVAARSLSTERRQQAAAVEYGLPPTAMLAPAGLGERPGSLASPGRMAGGRPASAALSRGPASVSGSAAGTPVRPSTAGGERATGAAAAAGEGRPPNHRAMVAKLEAEVAHLRQTIGVLLESEPTKKGGGAASGGSRRPGSAGGAAVGAAAVAAMVTLPDAGTRHPAAAAHGSAAEASEATQAVDAALADRDRAERRVMALEQAKRRLAAASRGLSSTLGGTGKPTLGVPASAYPGTAPPSPAGVAAISAAVRSGATSRGRGGVASFPSAGSAAGSAASGGSLGGGKEAEEERDDGAESAGGRSQQQRRRGSSVSGLAAADGKTGSEEDALLQPSMSLAAAAEAAFRDAEDEEREGGDRRSEGHAGGDGGGDGSGISSARRPRQGRSISITRPKEFSFMAAASSSSGGGGDDSVGGGGGRRPHSASIAARRAEEERREREKAEEAILSFQFKAAPVPPSARLPLFSLIMGKMEAKRRLEHEARTAELASSTKPFTQLMEHEEVMRTRSAAARARLELAAQKELAEGRRFRAVPVPATTTAPDGAYVQSQRREAERPQRVASAARALAASASLPPRMALAQEAEKRRAAEREARVKAEAAAERRLARFTANGLPDFGQLHAVTEAGLRDTRKGFAATVPQPFGFDSAARLAAEAGRKEARQREWELATSPSLVLRSRGGAGLGPGTARPASAGARGRGVSATRSLGGLPSGGGGSGAAGAELDMTMRSAASAFAAGGGGSLSARPSSAKPRRHSNASGLLGVGGGGGLNASVSLSLAQAPPAAMTRTVQLRMLEVQRRVRERQAEERAEAEAAEERARRVRDATRAIAPIVTRLEAERNPIPLAWQGGAVTNAASLARREFERTAARNLAEQKARIAQAEAARPLLMLRSTLELRREEARRSALIDAARRIGEPGNAAWEAVVQGALAPDVRIGGGGADGAGGGGGGSGEGELFDEEERELLGLMREGER